jgi:Fe2+ transport system protein FeoA
MNASKVTCPLCGHRFHSEARSVCGACPLAKGCEFICCPACGYQIPDTERSLIGRWLAAGFRRRATPDAAMPQTLADVPAGWSARIADTGGASAPRHQQLRAYGLEALTWVRVIQHRPVTVVAVAGTELALEAELARRVVVDSLRP